MGAALDWIWQLPVIAAVAMVVLALLTGPRHRRRGAARDRGRTRRAGVVAMLVAGVLVIGVQAVLWVGDAELRGSRSAAASGDLQEALDRADAARALQPWAASPQLQLALVRELAGDLPAARASIRRAIDRDASDWRLRLVSARLATKAGAIRDARAELRRARELNPRSPILEP